MKFVKDVSIIGDLSIIGSVYCPSISSTTTSKTLYYNPTTGKVTYGDPPTSSISLNDLSDVIITDASKYDIITVNDSGNWVNQKKEWYVDSSIIQPVNPNYNVKLGSIEIEENAGAVVLVDMSVTSSQSVGTEESYRFNIDGNSIVKVYSESNGSGGVTNTGLVVEANYQYIGDPKTNGSWRFYVSSGDLIFEKRVSGNWVEAGRFTA